MPHTVHRWLLLAGILLGAPLRVEAQAFIEHMTPPGVARGQATRVTIVGSDLDDALALWSSLPAGDWKAERVGSSLADRAIFDVTVSADAPLGLYGLRVATDDGLSNMQIFLVDDLPPTPLETIRESGLAAASTGTAVPEGPPPAGVNPIPVNLPIAIAGVFRRAEVDRFSIDVAAGERLSFEVVSSRLGKDADPLLVIRDAQGKIVAERDNDPGLFFDLRFEQTFTAAGRYTVELSDVRYHGNPHWSYWLRMGRFPAARVALPASFTAGESRTVRYPELPGFERPWSIAADAPISPFYHDVRRPEDDAATWVAATVSTYPAAVEIEPNDTPAEATPVTAPAVLCGVLERPGDFDYFSFELKKGDRLVIKGEGATLDAPTDLELFVVNHDGREVQRVDDVLQEEAGLTLSANADGIYRLGVHDVTYAGGPAYGYRIEVRRGGPHLTAVADFADLTIPQGGEQALPVIVTRTEFKGPIRLRLLGAPTGVTLEPSEIPEELTSLTCRVKAAANAPLGLATLQLVAEADVDGVLLSTLARTQPMIDRQLQNVDLIKYALRENQRRLPPSLSQKIALQVTPPSPFTFEPTDAIVTLVRYLSIEFPLVTTRQPGFDSPITFKARGGPIGEESEIRRQVYTRFINATPQQLIVPGALHSRNLPNDSRDRIDISATAEFGNRRVTLVRSFELVLKGGFDVTADPPSVAVLPGERGTFRVLANRVDPFTGPVTVEPAETPGIRLPARIEIPAGVDSVEVPFEVDQDFAPRKVRIRLPGNGLVGKFVEENRPKDVEIDVKKPEVKPAEGSTPAKK